MYDMHYDLLTILYYYFKRHENFDRLSEFLPELQKIYSEENIIGGIVNLYFAPTEEMKELEIGEKEMKDVPTMLKKSIQLLENMKTLDLIPEEIDFIYGIEGCNYIKIEELETLYNLGLRAITPVYKFKNSYGSGYLETGGLTEKGCELIGKAIDLGIIIDVSHSNEETFYDITKQIIKAKQQDQNPILIASHSNVRELCPRSRNLTKEQLLRLKECDGYISLLTNGNFLTLNNAQLTYKEREKEFLKHLNYLINEIGFSKNRILVASDDMNFHPNDAYHHLETFPLDKINRQITSLLTTHYDEELAKKITRSNAYQLLKKVK